MGPLHRFPEISSTRRNPLLQATPDFVRELKFFQKLADESVQKLTEAPLSVIIDKLETALAGIDAIGRLLPPGEFKTQFDLDQVSLSKQLDLVKSKIIGLWGQVDLVWE